MSARDSLTPACPHTPLSSSLGPGTATIAADQIADTMGGTPQD